MSDKKKYEVFYVGVGHGCYITDYYKKSIGFTWATSMKQAINNVRWRKKEEMKKLPWLISDSADMGFVEFKLVAEIIEEKEKKNMEEKKTEEMNWDSGLSATAPEMKLPPVGEYGFTIVEFEKTKSSTGKPMAKIKIKLDEDGWFYRIYDNLVITKTAEWKLIQFFECIGLKESGEVLEKMPWDKIIGAKGRVAIKHEIYNGNENCKVDYYITPTEATKAKSLVDSMVESISKELGGFDI